MQNKKKAEKAENTENTRIEHLFRTSIIGHQWPKRKEPS
jgi:hypothetical protein